MAGGGVGWTYMACKFHLTTSAAAAIDLLIATLRKAPLKGDDYRKEKKRSLDLK